LMIDGPDVRLLLDRDLPFRHGDKLTARGPGLRINQMAKNLSLIK
jgi:hypothetical protein